MSNSWLPQPPGSDEQMMWRVQTKDDAEAFAALVDRWQRPIQHLCYRMLGDAHRAEDVTQEAFARLHRKRLEYQNTGKFSTFLWRIALNLCYDELRRDKRRPQVAFSLESDSEENASFTPLESSSPGPDLLLQQQEQSELVRQALLKLPEIYRTVLVLKHYENLKFREIAEVLQIPEGTVKSRLAQGLSQLHRFLAHRTSHEKNYGTALI